jgi:hypothetical protein
VEKGFKLKFTPLNVLIVLFPSVLGPSHMGKVFAVPVPETLPPLIPPPEIPNQVLLVKSNMNCCAVDVFAAAVIGMASTMLPPNTTFHPPTLSCANRMLMMSEVLFVGGPGLMNETLVTF